MTGTLFSMVLWSLGLGRSRRRVSVRQRSIRFYRLNRIPSWRPLWRLDSTGVMPESSSSERSVATIGAFVTQSYKIDSSLLPDLVPFQAAVVRLRLSKIELIDALRSGAIRAAYHDLTDPEPLPPDHPLWFVPNCYITPHSSGGHYNEALRLTKHFLNNFRRLICIFTFRTSRYSTIEV